MGTVINGPGRIPDGRPPNPSDMILTYLPLCHVAERIFSTWSMLADGVVLNFAESIETVQANLREVAADPLLRRAPHLGEDPRHHPDQGPGRHPLQAAPVPGLDEAGRRDRQAEGGQWWRPHPDQPSALRARLFFVFRALRERIGLRRCRWAGSGAAPIAPEILRFFLGIGVPVYELYGMTENTAVATVNLVHRMKLGTVGEPYAGTGPPYRRRDRRDPDQAPRCVPRLLAGPGSDGRDLHRRRLAQDRRCRRMGGRDPRQDRRPDQAHHHHLGREEHQPLRDREPAEDIALDQGGDGGRRPAQVPLGADRDRTGHGGRLGDEKGHPLHDLSGPHREAAGARTGPAGGESGQQRAGLGRADKEVLHDPQGARPRGRRADRHPEAEAQRDGRACSPTSSSRCTDAPAAPHAVAGGP